MKVLLAIDQSPRLFTIIREILARTWPSDTTIRVVTAVEPFPVGPGTLDEQMAETLERAHGVLLSQAQETAGQAARSLLSGGMKVETAVCEGDPRSVIIDEAESWSADLIMI